MGSHSFHAETVATLLAVEERGALLLHLHLNTDPLSPQLHLTTSSIFVCGSVTELITQSPNGKSCGMSTRWRSPADRRVAREILVGLG